MAPGVLPAFLLGIYLGGIPFTLLLQGHYWRLEAEKNGRGPSRWVIFLLALGWPVLFAATLLAWADKRP